MARPTIRDVAKAAGVSLGTASRVVNRHSGVNPEMKRRVELAIERLGYRPNAVAQSMRMGVTRTVGILIRDFSSSAFVNFANVAQGVLFEAGYVTLLAGYDDRPELEIEILHAFAQRRIDGLIITTSSDNDPRLWEARTGLNIPTILFDRDSDLEKDIVSVDHREAIKETMRYLFELGHVRVALVTGPTSVRPGRERVIGYEEAYAEHGIKADLRLVRAASFSADYGHSQTSALLAMKKRPTAIIVGGVNMLSGVLHAIRSKGLAIPGDISIVSATNPELTELITPMVTELRVDYQAIGHQASRLMVGRLQGSIKGPPRTLEFGATLLKRESCAPPPAALRGRK